MEDEDLKPISNEHQEQLSTECPSRPSPKRSAELSSPATPPPSKLPRSSEACTCMLCGEEFENRKGLSSHARSHLRQIGVLDLLGKSSAIDTVQDLVSSGVLEAVHPPKMNSPTSLAPASTPPAEPPLSPSPGQSQTPIPSMSPNPVKYPPIQGTRAPKAKKGFRLAVDPLYRKPKLEPVDIDVSATGGFSSSPSTQKLPSSSDALKSFSADVKSPPTVLCDFCGQLFDTRKALSCHARAHLRQLGLTWSIRTSPIDLLKEVMMHGEEGSKGSLASSKPMWSPSGSRRSMDSQHSGRASSNPFNSPLDYSMKDKSGKSRASHTDKSCELCGFDFENRKALASHARAHLRQLGLVEWKTEGASSPIELLSELIRRDPARVAAVTRRYRMGDLYIKKRALASLSLSTDSESLPGHSSKPSSQQFDLKMGREDSDSFRKPHGHTQTMAATGNSGVHSPRGVRPPRHIVPSREDTQNTSSQHPPRSGSIPALVPRPPLTPLVKLVGKMYFLKCRFCEKVFQGPVSVQEQWITHLQKHILSLGYKGKASPPTAQVETPALVHPVAV
ncbi:protein Wiz [Aulostomus maculatus]